MSSIPLLDISRFDKPDQQREFVEDFGRAYRQWGFAGISNHGIDTDLIKNALRAAEQFFVLPVEQKKKYAQSTSSARGYTPFGVEKAKDASHTDLKEFYHVGREIDGVAHLTANLWPAQLPEFQATFGTIFNSLDALAHKILRVVALTLSLPADYFDSKVNHGDTILRVLHYPPIQDQEIPNLRAAEHEDINLITLLAGSEQAGLEVLSRTGEWVPISMIPGTIICNVGDMLQRLSNAQLPSTTHRVVNPEGDQARISRYSIPFFMHPNPDMSLAVLPQCIDDNHPSLFTPTTAGDYLQQRLREIGLIQ